ncbi:MAG TPA: asparagine synthase (glutamine-hydrolyzing) [Dongiaceae bacterium]|nr:asparagine synthase (glutamine-hydrolyzing) [Dongiaceae bacterium]
MCGIAGFQSIDDKTLIDRMRDAIRHRGPDGQGTFSDPITQTSLAHTRLSIIDLSPLGHQPMLTDDQQVALVFNGEIYNYQELRLELEGSGFKFRGHSDTEVLLWLYMRDGENCFARLNGIFSICIYDRRDGLLRLARDGLGVKPLYYSAMAGSFIFASEIKALLQCDRISREISVPAIRAVLSLLWIPGPWTPLQQIKKLLPGECLVVGQGRIQRQFSFYRLPVPREDFTLSVTDAIQGVRDRLSTAVARQMVADVPVGAFLSGGLDSSAVVAMAARHVGPDNIRCFTIDTGGGVDVGTPDDLPYAQFAARKLGVKLEVLKADPLQMLQSLSDMLWFLDEPQADPAPLNVMAIAGYARKQGYKVLLSGAGGDDIFSGYRRHVALQFERYWAWLPASLRSCLQQSSAGLTGVPRLRRMAKLFNHAGLPADKRLLSYFSWLKNSEVESLLSEEFKHLGVCQGSETSESASIELARALNEMSGTAPLNQMLYLESRFFLVDHNLNYTDKLSMAMGVETRVPLLDPDLVEFAARIPVAMKCRGTQGKWVFKQAMSGILPEEVIWRSKAGFGMPLRRWLHTELRPLVEDTLSRSAIERRGIFNVVAVQQLVAKDRAGELDASYSILALMVVELWCRQFIDGQHPF